MSTGQPERGPRAEQRPHTHSARGRERSDPYHWMRDDNWQQVMRTPEVLRAEIRAHLERENEHTARELASTEALQTELKAELRGRIQEDESSVPSPDGPWDYYVRYTAGGQHPLHCRRPSAGRAPIDAGGEHEQILHDADAASKEHAYYRPGDTEHSPDHQTLAFAADTRGSERFEVRFRQLGNGELLPDRLQDTTGSVVFSANGSDVWYTQLDDNQRPCRVLRHRLGTSADSDVLVYEEQDPGFFVSVGQTEDRKRLLIVTNDHTTTEVHHLRTDLPEQPPRCVAPRERDVEYSVSSLGADQFAILTNADGAEDFKLVTTPIEPSADQPGRQAWRDLAAHRPGTLRVAAVSFSRFLVRLETEAALPRIVVRDIESGAEHSISFDEPCYSLGLRAGYESDTDWLRFDYSSPTTPNQTFDYNMRSRERILLHTQRVPSGHDPARYRSARLMATSHDGAQVPVTLLWHEQTPVDAPAPVLLYAYGSYGVSIPASFSTNRLSLVNRGFIYAIAHPRGGKERGYAWYREGKLLKKKNTFLDVLAVAQHLVDTGRTKPGDITVHGGSAGGLTVGACINERPELFNAAVAEVPFVDVLTTMCDAELPLTPPEWPEWGNPLESDEAYDAIASYSPYDNLRPQAYPDLLATAGLTDPRVTYWEPSKWVARLREVSTGPGRLLLKTYMEAGHGGSAGRFDKLSEVALLYAFMLLCQGRSTTRPWSAT